MNEWLRGSCVLEELESESWDIRVALLYDMLKSCEPEREVEEDEEQEQTWTRDSSISMLVAEYRHWFKSDVLNEPWPFFLNQVHKMNNLKGEVGLANLSWYAAAKSEDALDNLMDRAGYVKIPVGDVDPVSIDPVNLKQQAENASAVAMISQMYFNKGEA